MRYAMPCLTPCLMLRLIVLPCLAAEKPRLNPAIQQILREVSESRIEATLTKLEDFGTRHIHSDQDHPTRGIGAASRWIHDELQGYSPRLQVSYDKFSLKKGAGTRARVVRDVDLVNVVAVLPGAIHSDRYVLVTAHYDSLAVSKTRTAEARLAQMLKRGVAEEEARRFTLVFPPGETRDTGDPEANADEPIAPGVTDDGSGTAAVLELARVMSKYEFDKSLVFIALADEEVGLEGSKAYAARAKKEMR